MKKLIVSAALVASLFGFGMQNANSTTGRPKHVKRHVITSQVTTATSRTEVCADSSCSKTAMLPTDPQYKNHPYFNGEARWTNPDSLYMHGDYPYWMTTPNTSATPNTSTVTPSR